MERYLSRISKPVQSYFYLALCILLWASIPVTSKRVLEELNNIEMLLYSTVFSFLIIGVILLFQGKFETMKNYSIKDYAIMIFLGFLGNYLYYILLYGALSQTTASEGFILTYTWPILVLILASLILKERLTFQKLIAIAISFSGIIVIVTHGKIFSMNFTSLVGNIMALTGAFTFAFFSILGKRFNFDKTISVFIYFTSTLFFVTLTCVFTSSIKLPSANVWMWLLYNGILVNGVSYIFWFKALEYGDTAIISNALYLTPCLSLVYISLFLNEKILFSSVVGLTVIVVGIVIQSINIKKPNHLK
jgi:drug/metabolite transporter (DMT)-like permease